MPYMTSLKRHVGCGDRRRPSLSPAGRDRCGHSGGGRLLGRLAARPVGCHTVARTTAFRLRGPTLAILMTTWQLQSIQVWVINHVSNDYVTWNTESHTRRTRWRARRASCRPAECSAPRARSARAGQRLRSRCPGLSPRAVCGPSASARAPSAPCYRRSTGSSAPARAHNERRSFRSANQLTMLSWKVQKIILR